eukprot:5248544-Alexandrium_andersonii.AAC.1
MARPFDEHRSSNGMTMTRDALNAHPQLPTQVVVANAPARIRHVLRAMGMCLIDLLPSRTCLLYTSDAADDM